MSTTEITGIVAVQGAFAEHARMLEKLGVHYRLLRSLEDYDDSVTRVILPGGESTAQGKLLEKTGLGSALRERIGEGQPVLGTCAGMILLARSLDDSENAHLATLDVRVRRNAYGRQLGSFVDEGSFDELNNVPMVFIRAPFVVSVGPCARASATVNGRIVGVRQESMIATSFHPELTEDTRIHELFLDL